MGTNGVLNVFLVDLFRLGRPALTIYGLGGAVFVLTLSYFPFATLLTIAGLESLDRRLEEAGSLSHRTSGVLKKITLPLISPHIWSAGIFVFIFSISNYSVPDLLRVNAYPIEIVQCLLR